MSASIARSQRDERGERDHADELGVAGRDLAIVGGGPAGLTAALALVRAAPALAARIVVIEKGAYPRDKFCAGALGGRGERLLRELDAWPDTPALPIRGMSLAGSDGRVTARFDRPLGQVIRRMDFDASLAGTVRARGVLVLEATRVEAITALDHGARIDTSRGAIHASIVVGADGVGSRVRRAMGIPTGDLRAQVLEVDTERLPGEPDDLLRFDASERDFSGYYWDFPTPVAGRTLVSRGVYHLTRELGIDLEARLGARLARLGLDLARCTKKRFAERGFELPTNLASGHLLLLGEAAGIDPITGEGIAQAIEYGVLLGAFLPAVIAGRRPLEAWTEVVHQSRLGRDLRARTALVETFFGADRPAIERLFIAHPAVLRAGCRHFAGLPQQRTDLAAAAIHAFPALLRALSRRAHHAVLSRFPALPCAEKPPS
jgi:menaquinone-9 beta-reductase